MSLTDMYEYLNSDQILAKLCGGSNTVMRDEIIRLCTRAGKHRCGSVCFVYCACACVCVCTY